MMDHVAILAKKRRLLAKIRSGEKKIESRWYISHKPPFRSINKGDTIYFKESGEPVSVMAKVEEVMFYDALDKSIFDEIISKYGSRICIDSSFWDLVKDKRLVTLIFLKDVVDVKPFGIDKSGYGMMAAWMTIADIEKIKIPL